MLINTNAHKCVVLVTRGSGGARRSRGARSPRGAERGLRRSSRFKLRNPDEVEGEEEETTEEEEVLSSQQSPVKSTTQSTQSSSQQSLRRVRSVPIFIDPDTQTTPVITIDADTPDIIIRRSRSSTPIIPEGADVTSPLSSPRLAPHRTSIQTSESTPTMPTTTTVPPSPANHIEAMLFKQGKQLIGLYEMQKKIIDKIDNIEIQLKKIIKNKNTELSPKVFSVSNI